MTRKSKKTQMKIQEMSFMLLALVLFFIIAGLFFLLISNASLKKSAESLSESKAITAISKLAETPELSCGKQLCADTDKLIAVKNNLNFANYWEIDGGLIIKKIYPYTGEDIECEIGNYEQCNKFTLKEVNSGYKEVSSYVVLCKKESNQGYSYDKCELGKISAYLEKAN